MRAQIPDQPRYRTIAVVLIALVVLFGARPLFGLFLSNLAMVGSLGVFAQEAEGDMAVVKAPAFFGAPNRSRLVRAEKLLHLALRLNQADTSNYRRLALVATANGDPDSANSYLAEIADELPTNPVLYYHQLHAWDRQGRYAEIIDAYERILPRSQLQRTKDVVALAYLEQYGPSSAAIVQNLRSYDLYANYELWSEAQARGDSIGAEKYRSSLVNFTKESILPSDPRLFAYVAATVPFLFQHGIWDRETILNVVSALVWQRYADQNVAEMLDKLSADYPLDPDWPFYRAELDYRRRALHEAREGYLEALWREPEYAPAHLKLGMLVASRMANESPEQHEIDEAVHHLAKYTAMRPDDLLGWKQLATICLWYASHLAPAQCQELRGANYSDAQVLAHLLDLPDDAVELGLNLVQNGEFEDWNSTGLLNWEWTSISNLPPSRQRLFLGAPDDFATIQDSNTARIHALRPPVEMPQITSGGGYMSWDMEGGHPHVIPLEPGRPYLLSFYYRTDLLGDEGAGVYLADKNDMAPFWTTGDYGLRRTGGAWYHVLAIGTNSDSYDFAIVPRLRSFTTGTVQFESFALRPITISKQLQPETSNRIWVLTGEDFPLAVED